MRLRIECYGFRVWGSGFGVWGSGFRLRIECYGLLGSDAYNFEGLGFEFRLRVWV